MQLRKEDEHDDSYHIQNLCGISYTPLVQPWLACILARVGSEFVCYLWVFCARSVAENGRLSSRKQEIRVLHMSVLGET
jgi:hypothetical protein